MAVAPSGLCSIKAPSETTTWDNMTIFKYSQFIETAGSLQNPGIYQIFKHSRAAHVTSKATEKF